MRARLLAPFAALLLAACGGVYSTHPASDETTTRFDERLIGFWRVDAPATFGAQKAEAQVAVLAVGRAEAGKVGLRVGMLSMEGEVVTAFQGDLAPTTIASRDHASVRLSERDPSWIVVRYELEGEVLRVLGMDAEVVTKDVRAGAVAGRATERKEGELSFVRTVTLEATTPVLRAWLEKRGDALWKKDEPLVLRRLKLE
jgi:hypothetical protein